MRESRTSGSERGKPRKGLTYLPNFISYRIKKMPSGGVCKETLPDGRANR